MAETTETARLTADVVLLATREDGQRCVLLIRRGWDPYAGCWALPGGHVDAGEHTDAAARRELAEETGLDVHSLDLVGVYAAPGRDPRGRYVTFAYTTTLAGPLPAPTAGDDATEASWWPISELVHGRAPMAFDHDQILADALATQRFLVTAPGPRSPHPSPLTGRNTVITYLNLDGHYTEHARGGVSVGTVATTVALSRDLVVQMPTPFKAIGDGLAIAPAITPDGDTAVRIDFTRWSPMRYGLRGTFVFPLNFTGQDLAVTVARAFDADPRASWGCTGEEAMSWLRQHSAHLGLTV